MNPTPPTLEEVQNKRISQLLKACIGMLFGSVWRIGEGIWKEKFRQQGQRYDWNNKRQWHPGVSVRTEAATSLHEYIPMLHGSSGDHGPVVVRGLSKELAADHPTSFGTIVRPAKISVKDITLPSRIRSKEQLQGRLIDRSIISANMHKMRLDEAELESLRSWAKNRNLI